MRIGMSCMEASARGRGPWDTEGEKTKGACDLAQEKVQGRARIRRPPAQAGAEAGRQFGQNVQGWRGEGEREERKRRKERKRGDQGHAND